MLKEHRLRPRLKDSGLLGRHIWSLVLAVPELSTAWRLEGTDRVARCEKGTLAPAATRSPATEISGNSGVQSANRGIGAGMLSFEIGGADQLSGWQASHGDAAGDARRGDAYAELLDRLARCEPD